MKTVTVLDFVKRRHPPYAFGRGGVSAMLSACHCAGYRSPIVLFATTASLRISSISSCESFTCSDAMFS